MISPFDGVPVGFRGLLDQGLIEDDETEDMVAHQGDQGTDGQGKQHDNGYIFQNLPKLSWVNILEKRHCQYYMRLIDA